MVLPPEGAADRKGSQLAVQTAESLRVAFSKSRHPMLIADDQRRWVTGNAAACDLLGITWEDIPWHAMDDYTPPSERKTLEEQWQAFLGSGTAEGWYELLVPTLGPTPVEFSARANVLPSRHLAVFIKPEGSVRAAEAAWKPITVEERGLLPLTTREREVMTLVATGLHNSEMAEQLFVSQETVKSHVHNAMGKLGAHTRAGAVAIALVTGQIIWEGGGAESPAPPDSPPRAG